MVEITWEEMERSMPTAAFCVGGYMPMHKEHLYEPSGIIAVDLSLLGEWVNEDDCLCLSCRHLDQEADNGVYHTGFTEYTWRSCCCLTSPLTPEGLCAWVSHGAAWFSWMEIHDCQFYEEASNG